MLEKTPLGRAIAVAAYLSVAVPLALAYPNVSVRPGLLLIPPTSLAVIALAGSSYPGALPALSLLYTAAHLYAAYTSGGVDHVSMISLLLVLLIPFYLSVVRVRDLVDAVASCCHVAAYILAIAWLRSLSASLALFASLSVVSSPPVAAFSVASYSTLLIATAYAGQFSTANLPGLGAVPGELLGVDREALIGEAVFRLGVALAVYALGFSAARLVERSFPVPDVESPKGVARRVLRSTAISVSLALATVYAFDRGLAGAVEASTCALALVGALTLVKVYQERASEAYNYALSFRALAENLEHKANALGEVIGCLGEELDALRGAAEVVEGARGSIRELSKEVASATIPSYARVRRAYERLAELDAELDRRFEALFEELRKLLEASYEVSHVGPREELVALTSHLSVERWRVIPSLAPRISGVLERYCDAMREVLETRIPEAYSELFGFRPALRRVEGCRDRGIKAILAYRDYISALLVGLERQLDAVLEALERLAKEADELNEFARSLGTENPYILELARIYRSHFSRVHALRASDPLTKLDFLVDAKRSVTSSISVFLRKTASPMLGIKELDATLAALLEPVREALARVDDRDVPLVDLVPLLGGALRAVFGLTGLPPGIAAIAAGIHRLERLRPLVEEYVKEGLRRGYEFEEVFPLRDELRPLWTLLRGSGGGDAV